MLTLIMGSAGVHVMIGATFRTVEGLLAKNGAGKGEQDDGGCARYVADRGTVGLSENLTLKF